jgi:hypothetical protein
MRQYKPVGKTFKSNSSKGKLRENRGQWEPKERHFKQGFKEQQGERP